MISSALAWAIVGFAVFLFGLFVVVGVASVLFGIGAVTRWIVRR